MTEPTLPLVDAAWLAEHLDDPRLRVVDATVHLSFDENGAHIASAEETYRAEHIPGAVFIDQDAELSRDERFALLSAELVRPRPLAPRCGPACRARAR